MRRKITNVLVGVLIVAFSSVVDANQSFYVAREGNDANAGTIDAPFATVEHARDAIRQTKSSGAITVFLRKGTYERNKAFDLTKEDSGSGEAPIVYRAYEDEEVRLVGGRRVPADAFTPVQDADVLNRLDPATREHIVQADLRGLGFDDLGEIPVQYQGSLRLPELFFNDEPMQIACWPDEGWAEVKRIVQQGARRDNNTEPGQLPVFEYEGDRPSRWDMDRGVWLEGYWCFDWREQVVRIGKIDTDKKQITLAAAHYYGLRQGNPAPRRYRALHVLEELDRPGEYLIDRQSGVLYFWPPKPIESGRAVVSTLKDPMIRTLDTSHVRFRGLTIEACRDVGVRINGGTDIQVLACTIRNTGTAGIVATGGQRHRVEACDIYNVGTRGILLIGGDRKTLTPGHHEAVNNHVHHFSRLQRTYASAIELGGVGCRMAHNLIHHGPHQAITPAGNDHIVEYNIVHHVCLETDDCGASYTGRNPSMRGHIVRYNYWHHIGTQRSHGNAAVYWDDGDGGNTVFGNVFYKAGHTRAGGGGPFGAVFVHGGHDNIVDNNIFVECDRAIGAAPWNADRWKEWLEGDLWKQRLLEEVDITKPPYTTRYPGLANYFESWKHPRMNSASRNVAVHCRQFISGNYEHQDNFITDEDPGFVDAAKDNFALRVDSIVFDKVPGFEAIPFDKIGPYRDELRKVVTQDPSGSFEDRNRIYVSTDGNDGALGTESAPFKTISRAQKALRERIGRRLDEDLVVIIRGGTYFLDKPLVFGPEDGGTEAHAVIYTAALDETPVISAGQEVTGFKQTGKNQWVIELPEVKEGKWWFRQLFKDGKRQTRARFPNHPDVLRIKETSEDVTRITFDQPLIGGESIGQDAELVVIQNWCITRARIASMQNTSLTAMIPVGWIGHGAEHNANWTTASPGKAAFLEHAAAFVDQPGEWHLDRGTGRLTYMSAEGDDPNKHVFIASRLRKAAIVQGDRDKPVRNLHFRGLTFAHTEWELPDFGYIGTQAGHHGTNIHERIHVLPAAVEMTYAEDCRLERCRIVHSGASGIGLGAGCRRDKIDRCEIADISGNGVMSGLRADREFTSNKGNWGLISDWTDPKDIPVGNEITNNHIHHCGVVYSGCVGIYDAYCDNTLIAHNLVTDMPYTGISIGFKWNTEPSSQKGCRVEYNHVRDVMTLLADGGAIYTLGYQPGTVLRGNLLHDVRRGSYSIGAPNNGIFFDQGSSGYLVEDNIIYNTSAKPIRFNQCKEQDFTWKNNHFGVAPDDPDFPREAAQKAGPLRGS